MGEYDYFSRFQPWQLDLVKEIHLFAQMFWLEDEFLDLCKEEFMRGVEKVKVTFRRGDWWNNEYNSPLGINPQRGNADVEEMKSDWRKEREGEIIPWRQRAWGCGPNHLKSLKELEIEFETSEDKVDELKEIVEHAKTWKFPMRDGLVLSTEGLEMKTSTWRGTMCHWSAECPYCGNIGDCAKDTFIEDPRKECEERMKLRSMDLGPMLTVTGVRWRLMKGKASEGEIVPGGHDDDDDDYEEDDEG